MQQLQSSRNHKEWLDHLTSSDGTKENKSHPWAKDTSWLITSSTIDLGKFIVSNGANLYTSTIIPALESAQYEIIFVTCFWARSSALDQLFSALISLSTKAKTRSNGTPKLRVRVCFSSYSLIQKLLHTSSPAGHIYPPSKWQSLGLPAVGALEGLDLQVKSLFFLPFSVMHPKFVIIDRQSAFLPSCNLSYESWLECCLPVFGPAVKTLVDFWHHVWAGNDFPPLPARASNDAPSTFSPAAADPFCTTILLPSPHHRSPRFRPFLTDVPPPPTPLNTYLLHLFATASKSIRLITPNLTSPPVIAALLAALGRGVEVEIITNRRMMILAQLFTAGTITEFCVWRFRRRYRNLLHSHADQRSSTASSMEAGLTHEVGKLGVGYIIPSSVYKRSHIKCTIVDEEVIVLGSGNMDRASWYTSQELGIALEGAQIVSDIWGVIDGDASLYGGVEWLAEVK